MHTIYISSEDNERLRLLLILTPFEKERRRDLDFLRAELDRASIVVDDSDRSSVIRIGSRFEFLDAQTGATGTHILCLPHETPFPFDGLSVTSRFGAAAIGCRAGDEVQWETPVGWRRILIRNVQPVEAGHASNPAIAGVASVASSRLCAGGFRLRRSTRAGTPSTARDHH